MLASNLKIQEKSFSLSRAKSFYTLPVMLSECIKEILFSQWSGRKILGLEVICLAFILGFQQSHAQSQCTLEMTHEIVPGAGLTEGVSLEVSGGTPFEARDESASFYRYGWTDKAGKQLSVQKDISDLGPGTYNVKVTDKSGCKLEKSYTLEGKAVISLSALNLEFGNIPINTTTFKSFTLTNNGNTALNVSAIKYPEGFTGNWSKGTIAVGKVQEIKVTFSPREAKSYTATISVESNDRTGKKTLTVSGKGISTPNTVNPGISLSPASLDFSDIPINTTVTKVLTISNTGNTDLNVTNITSTGEGFTAAGEAGTITIGNSKDVVVTFNPTREGAYLGGVTVESNAEEEQKTVNIVGRGMLVTDINPDRSLSGIKIFPNPATNMLHVELPNDITEPIDIQLANISGQVVYEQRVEGAQLTIDVSDYKSGVYLLVVRSGSKAKKEIVILSD